MMGRNTLIGLLIFYTALCSSVVHATHTSIHDRQNGYFGFAGISLDDEDYSSGGGLLIAGLDLNPFLAVESHLGVTSEDSNSSNGIETSSKINYFSSLRLRFNYHTRKFIPYAYIGYSGINLSTTIKDNNTNTSKETEDGHGGFSYGIGIDLFGNKRTSIFISTGVLLDKSDSNVELNLRSTIVGFRYFLSRQNPIRF